MILSDEFRSPAALPRSTDVLDAIRARRSVKQYDPDHHLSASELRALLAAAALAPTAFNLHNKHFVAVTDPAVKRRLQEAANGQPQVRDASVTVVITGDLSAHLHPDRYLRDAAPEVREQLEAVAPSVYEGRPELLRDEALRSVGLAAMNLMLAANALGYDSCPMSGFDPDAVSRVLELDEDHPPMMLVAVGRGVQAPFPRLGLLRLDEVASIDRFGAHALDGEVLDALEAAR